MRCYERTYDHAMPEHLKGGHYGFPLLVQLGEDEWMLLTEAAVHGHYGASHLVVDANNGRHLRTAFAPDQFTSVQAQLPFTTPWRVMIIGTLETLVASS